MEPRSCLTAGPKKELPIGWPPFFAIGALALHPILFGIPAFFQHDNCTYL